MEYSKEFRNLLYSADKHTFIGAGNPNAKILFVANEMAIPDEKGPQYEREILNNRQNWIDNAQEKIDFDNLPNSVFRHELYNPLHPYKGQVMKIDNGRNGGVSRMWYNQQKLSNLIFGPDNKEPINFHKYCFSTEFSVVPAKSSKLVDPMLRTESIQARLSLFRHPFFLEFPVIIVACGHYVRDIPVLNDLTEVFRTDDVKIFHYDGPGSNKEWINVHHNDDGRQILLHTKHFSSSISDDYLLRIASICKKTLNI